MKRLVEVLNGKEDDEKNKDREAKARCWTRERGLEEISIKRLGYVLTSNIFQLVLGNCSV